MTLVASCERLACLFIIKVYGQTGRIPEGYFFDFIPIFHIHIELFGTTSLWLVELNVLFILHHGNVKWNSPFYGVPGKGWFLSVHVFSRYVKATFFAGASLRPGARR